MSTITHIRPYNTKNSNMSEDQIEIAYIESKGKYFVMTNKKGSFVLESKEKLENYINNNNCKVLNNN